MGIRAGSCTVQHGLSNVTYEAYRRCLNGQKAAALHACLCPRDLAVTPSTPPPPFWHATPLRSGSAAHGWLLLKPRCPRAESSATGQSIAGFS